MKNLVTVHSVHSNVAKIHSRLPAAMEFWLVCLGILAYSCQNISPFGRTKKVGLWGKICVSIGEPYYIDCDDRRLSQEQTERFTQELREKVMGEMEKAERMLHG